MADVNLFDLAAECILRQANSAEPGMVLAGYFLKAFELGVQQGIRRTSESLDVVAEAKG